MAMAKQPDRKISGPNPTRGQRVDITELESKLRNQCQFNGDETATVYEVATGWAVEMNIPVKQSITMAFRVYWRLVNEKS